MTLQTSPSVSSRLSWSDAVWSVLIGTSSNMPGSGRRTPMSQYPPSSAGPRTASDARRQESRRRTLEIRHGHLRRVHANEQYRASGAFPRVVDCSGQALAEPTPTLRHDDEPAGDPTVGLTLEGDHRGSTIANADNFERVRQCRRGHVCRLR